MEKSSATICSRVLSHCYFNCYLFIYKRLHAADIVEAVLGVHGISRFKAVVSDFDIDIKPL